MHTVRGKRTIWKRMTDVLPPNSQKGIKVEQRVRGFCVLKYPRGDSSSENPQILFKNPLLQYSWRHIF